jgi:hypothetical protein
MTHPVLGEPTIGPKFDPLGNHGFTVTTDFEDNPTTASKTHDPAAASGQIMAKLPSGSEGLRGDYNLLTNRISGSGPDTRINPDRLGRQVNTDCKVHGNSPPWL